ncbi:MAG: hypothetical protein NZM11_10630, partial [Anaerolineales bacterium]|nr:hypothetical protein [Anaerolineales bacterium]
MNNLYEKKLELHQIFKKITGYEMLLWQKRLLDRFLRNDIPTALSLPTGLGKTSTIPIWLIARSVERSLPRRLVYVVDRRVVVDQASREAERLRERLNPDTTDPIVVALRESLALSPGQQLAVSPLRGGIVDNAAWRVDPAAPAIIVGTVDMIGSRLLFEGYGVGRRMRPLQAGLLGCDCLV